LNPTIEQTIDLKDSRNVTKEHQTGNQSPLEQLQLDQWLDYTITASNDPEQSLNFSENFKVRGSKASI
jgi:hypothetical protein